jgi:hypothetical protein
MSPEQRALHCPFLNRADSRCSNHFSLDRLNHAFDHCFDRYKSCPTYLELLVERRVRRAGDAVLRIPGRSAASEPEHDPSRLVQLRLPAQSSAVRYQQSLA